MHQGSSEAQASSLAAAGSHAAEAEAAMAASKSAIADAVDQGQLQCTSGQHCHQCHCAVSLSHDDASSPHEKCRCNLNSYLEIQQYDARI